MLSADIPANEAKRLAVLQSIEILDSGENPGFESLVKLVEQVFGVPMVAVSFVDEKRQWFKSSIGLPVCETRREVSFCAHVVANGNPLVIEDAMLDDRFFDNPLVTGAPHLKFYAGVPLTPFDDVILGTLCLMSDKPRSFSDNEYRLLIQFAKQVEILIQYHFDQVQLNALRQKERDAHEFLLSIINATNNPILVRQPESDYFLANDSALKAVGANSIKEFASAVSTALGEEQKLELDKLDHRVLASGQPERKRLLLNNDRYFDVVKSRLSGADQKIFGIVTVAHDVTDLIENTERLEQQQRLLALMHDAEKRANNAKSDFFSSMSHELKTPLHAIAGFSQLLMKSQKETLSEKQSGHVQQIYESSQYLLSLINDVLDLAQIEAGAMSVSMTTVSLNAIAKDAVETIAGLPLAQKLSIDFDEGNDKKLTAYADEKRLRQVFYNLLSNAVKYNSKQGQILVKWRPLEKNRVRIEIADTGIGISPEKEAELFQAFNRLGYEDNHLIDGNGLGLALTQRILESLKGRIGFSSSKGKGSTFWFELRKGESEYGNSERHC